MFVAKIMKNQKRMAHTIEVYEQKKETEALSDDIKVAVA